MIKEIISGGQTGAERAALDVAIKLDIPHGGWIPNGRKTENGKLPEKYQLQEMPPASYSKRTEENVIDSDGTLILSHGKLTGGSVFTREMAMKHGQPWFHIDFDKVNAFDAAHLINSWVVRQGISVLNVAGPRATKDPKIYQATAKVLETAVRLAYVKTNSGDHHRTPPSFPRTVNEAVDRLVSEMSLKDKIELTRMNENQLGLCDQNLGKYIKNNFGLRTGNQDLVKSCRFASGKHDFQEDKASAVIIKILWEKLRKTHMLRTVR